MSMGDHRNLTGDWECLSPGKGPENGGMGREGGLFGRRGGQGRAPASLDRGAPTSGGSDYRFSCGTVPVRGAKAPGLGGRLALLVRRRGTAGGAVGRGGPWAPSPPMSRGRRGRSDYRYFLWDGARCAVPRRPALGRLALCWGASGGYDYRSLGAVPWVQMGCTWRREGAGCCLGVGWDGLAGVGLGTGPSFTGHAGTRLLWSMEPGVPPSPVGAGYLLSLALGSCSAGSRAWLSCVDGGWVGSHSPAGHIRALALVRGPEPPDCHRL
jgi:hypothetical protein